MICAHGDEQFARECTRRAHTTMMPDIQSIVGTAASAVAIIAGILALIDRWASRRQPPALASFTSPSGLIVLSRPLPRMKPQRPPLLLRAVRLVVVLMAWFVSFVAGANLFGLTIALLVPLVPRVVQAAAATDLTQSTLSPVDVLAMLIVTTFLTVSLLTTSGWQRRGLLIAAAIGFLVPNGDLWLWLLR
jgi:phosphate/sulfate permease